MRKIPKRRRTPKFYADRELTEQDGQQLSDVIRYAVNSEKTQETGSEDGAPLHRFVSGINCSPATARDEMLAVKKAVRQGGRHRGLSRLSVLCPRRGHARTGA